MKDDEIMQYLNKYTSENMNVYDISTLVNSPHNDMSDVLLPA